MIMGAEFANGGWLAHLAFFLLVAAIAAPPMPWMRIGLILSALAGLAFAILIRGEPALAFWQFVILVVSLAMLTRYLLTERKTRFNEEEEALRSALLPSLQKSAARHLMDQGNWINGQKGEVVIREGEPVTHLFYLFDGKATVTLSGKPIAECGAGDLLGDVTALSGEPATGTVTLASATRFWCIGAPQLRGYLNLHPESRTAIERRINASLDTKLRAANAKLAGN